MEKLWKEMVSDWKTFAQKGFKIAAQKIGSFSVNFALLAGFSKHQPCGPMLSKSCFVHMCVCVFVLGQILPY